MKCEFNDAIRECPSGVASCERCGWNPEVERARIAKLRERFDRQAEPGVTGSVVRFVRHEDYTRQIARKEGRR